MKRFLLIACILFGIPTFSQSNTISWYKLFKGKIDQYPVTLHMHKSGHGYFGYYYYDSQQKPIYFLGDDTTLKGRVQLLSYADAEEAEYFIFSLTATTAAGEWKKTEKSKTLSFSAAETILPTTFTYVFTNGSTKLRPNWKDSPEANFSAASVWPLGKRQGMNF